MGPREAGTEGGHCKQLASGNITQAMELHLEIPQKGILRETIRFSQANSQLKISAEAREPSVGFQLQRCQTLSLEGRMWV